MSGNDVRIPRETAAEPESRNWTRLIVGLVVVLALVVGGAIGRWLGSDDDDAADGDDPQLEIATELADAFGEGWVSGDAEMVTTMLAEDGVYVVWTGDRITRSEMPTFISTNAPGLTRSDRVTDLTRLGDGVYAWVTEFDWRGQTSRGVLALELEDDMISSIGWIHVGHVDDYDLFPPAR